MGRPFGQHFLRDQRVLDDILDAAAIRPGERVLEIGPGRGVLTGPLAEAVGVQGRVVAVEADPAMASPLFGRWPNVDIVLRDVMQVDLARLGPFDAVVANLPYQISGPVTALLLDLLETHGWGRAVLMYQKEFGDRLVAPPGGKAFGKLSVQVQRLCEVEVVRAVPPGCFDPPPRVDSIVLRLVPRPVPLFAAEPATLRRVLDAAFGQRRKQLHNTLGTMIPRDTLEAIGVASLRPEQVDVATWGRIVAAAGGTASRSRAPTPHGSSHRHAGPQASPPGSLGASDGLEFDGISLALHPDVYKPHDDTFLLARVVAQHVGPGVRVLEVGCGAGLIALVAARAGAMVTATDSNPHAVQLALHNARTNDLHVDVVEADLLHGLEGPFDVVAFNPPYLPTSEDEKVKGPLNLAFDGGLDGNDTVLRFADQVVALHPQPAQVFVVHSSLSDPSALERRMAQAGYAHEVVARQKLWFEELWVRRFSR